jgi:hypothetical protein
VVETGGLENRFTLTGNGGSNPSPSATESISFRISCLMDANSPHLAGKPWFFEQSENQVHCDDPTFTPEFSERNSSSSFLEMKMDPGSMSHLDGEVELQTRSLKMDVRFEIPLGLAK